MELSKFIVSSLTAHATENEQVFWLALYKAALKASQRAYAPFSNFKVGAAGLLPDGSIATGANIESVSYGLTLCAECSLISDSVNADPAGFSKIIVVDSSANIIPPCGRCAQLLTEHAAPDALILVPTGIVPVTNLLPYTFNEKYF